MHIMSVSRLNNLYYFRTVLTNFADDLGVWRATWNKIGKPYITQYHKFFPVSLPEEDHDDRNALYAT